MKWEPISTAPKDGTWVLVYCGEIGKQMVGFNCDDSYWESYPGFNEIKPTHWIPLPKPPKE